MSFLEKITGEDIKNEFKAFEERAKKLPTDYKEAWEKIKENLWQYSDFTGRNLIPILDSALNMLEETAAEGKSVHEVLGNDIKEFCCELVGEDGANTFRGKWRKELNNNIARRLGK